jgi:hypothetical protein
LLTMLPSDAAERTLGYLHQGGIAQRLRQLGGEAANTSLQVRSAV